METITLEKRDILGKKSRNILKDGFMPAVVYNAKGESFNVKLDSSVAKKIVKTATSTTIFEIKLGEKTAKVLVKDVDFNPVTEDIRHISFFEVDENKEMVFSIPFELVGISPAVKNNIGILVKVMPALEVRCKLADLKPSIAIDISQLEHPGQIIEVHDIKLPEGINLINKEIEQATIVTITEIQKEEVATAAPAEGATATEEAAPAEEAKAE
jgi:large subunit ribosomal protein L25